MVTVAVQAERVNLAQSAEWMPQLAEAKFTLSSTYKNQLLIWIADDFFRLHKYLEWAGTFTKTKFQSFFGDDNGTQGALFSLETVLFRTINDV